MSTEIKTLQNPAKTKAYLPRTCLKAVADKNGDYISEDVLASDINALKNGALSSLSGKIFYASIVSSLSIQDSTWITDPFDLPSPSVLSRVSFIFDNDSQGYYGFIQKNKIGQIRIRTINGSGTVVAVGDQINITGIVA